MNQTSIYRLSPQTSASHVPTVVQNLRQLDDTCLTVSPPARNQPQLVVNLIETFLRFTAATGVAANLSTTAILTLLLPIVTSSHQPYLPPFSRREVNPRQPLGRAFVTNGPHKKYDANLSTNTICSDKRKLAPTTKCISDNGKRP